MQHRQPESERFAGAGLGEAENVVASKAEGNGFGLNRGRGCETGMRQFPGEHRREAELFKF